MLLVMAKLEIQTGKTIFQWTFIGTNTGPDGTGNKMRFSGIEEWTLAKGGLIKQSMGNFDNEEYQHPLEHGVDSGN